MVGLVGPAGSLGAAADHAADAPVSALVADALPWWASWDRDADGDRIDDAIRDVVRARAAGDTVPDHPAIEQDRDGLRFDVFVRYAEAPDARDVRRLVEQGAEAPRPFPWADVVHVRAVTWETLVSIANLPGVVGVELERVVRPQLDHATPAVLVNTSKLFGIGARERWKVDGSGVGIAVLDTGIDQEHDTFDPTRFLGGYDATVPTSTLASGTSSLANEQDPDDRDPRTHGTHVASIAVGSDPNGTHVAPAPGASYLDVRVMASLAGETFGTTGTPYGIGSQVLEGLDFVRRYNAGESHLGEPDVPVRIVTMSFSETTPDKKGTSMLSHAVNRLVDEGYLVVAAAGNCGPANAEACCESIAPDDCTGDGHDAIAAPGAAKRALTVAALDGRGTLDWIDDLVAPFSSRGPNGGEPKPNIAAYGVSIMAAQGAPGLTARATSEYVERSGTSMAVPLVAGVAALMMEANRSLDGEAVKRMLLETARDVAAEGWDSSSGSGAVNAYFAVGVALGILDPATTRIDSHGHDIPDLKGPTPPETPPEPPAPEPANLAPDVLFTFGPSAPLPGEDVVFVDRSIDPEGKQLVSFAWDFGDGSTAKGKRVVHAYDAAGEYVVRLTVTDGLGMAGSARETVYVVGGAEVNESSAPAMVPLLLVSLLFAWVGLVVRRDAAVAR